MSPAIEEVTIVRFFPSVVQFHIICSFFILFLFVQACPAEPLPDNPVEVGNVHWSRDFKTTLTESRGSGKPIFVLFQEIPGCIGCQTFGSKVLTHPLLVEAIESEFLPILVYNSKFDGEDKKILDQFNEPGWNYQVIRFINSKGEDVIPRKDKIWTISGVASRMILALQKLERPIPLYLQNLVLEYDNVDHGQIGFAMACYWTGEYKLGKVNGVVATETGWYDNREVTLVTYHKDFVTTKDLIDYAAQEHCAQRVYSFPGDQLISTKLTVKPFRTEEYKKAQLTDQKKQLSLWPQIGKIQNLTQLQRVKLNSFAPDDRKRALQYLSPRQLNQLLK